MNDSFKQRLVGAVVLVALAIILWPVVMGPKRDQSFVIESDIPDKPQFGPSAISEPKAREDVSPIGSYQRTLKAQQAKAEQAEAESEAAAEPVDKVEKKPVAKTRPALDQDGLPVGWEIRVGSFGDLDNANRVKQSLVKLGYRAQMVKNGKLHRVFVGPYIDKAIAQRNLDRIAKEAQLKPALVRFIPPSA